MKIDAMTPCDADVESLCRLCNLAVAGESDLYRNMSAQAFDERLGGLRDVPADLVVIAAEHCVRARKRPANTRPDKQTPRRESDNMTEWTSWRLGCRLTCYVELTMTLIVEVGALAWARARRRPRWETR